MTYMRPVYEPVSVPSALAYKYRLYRYHEIHHDGTVLSPTSTMEAHPVLFVPGHAGSYKQVRGFASQAAKLIAHTAKPLDHPVDLDVPDSYWKNLVIREEISKLRGVNHSSQAVKPLIFFTLDLSEELSAFRGDLLLNQADYLVDCIRRLQLLFPHWRSFLILGHSMGGVVARLALQRHPVVHTSVSLILTLNSPHTAPPLMISKITADIYRLITVPDEQVGFY